MVCAVISTITAAEKTVGEYSQRFPDEVLDQRLCVSMVVGFEYLAMGLSNVLHRYLRFYNDPKYFKQKTENYERYKQVVAGEKSVKGVDIEFDITTKPEQGHVTVEASGFNNLNQALVLKRPVRFESNKGAKGKVGGVLEFGLQILITNHKSPNKNTWEMKLSKYPEVKLVSFKCAETIDCDAIKRFVVQDLPD